MEKGTHGLDEKTFKELDYAGQARALNATILQVERAVKAHLKTAIEKKIDTSVLKKAYEDQLLRVIEVTKSYK